MLARIFAYTPQFTHLIENALGDVHFKDIRYSETRVIIKGLEVTIQPALYPHPEEYEFAIAKPLLLDLITQWHALTADKPKHLLLKRDAVGIISWEKMA